jgi:hypothetical protein
MLSFGGTEYTYNGLGQRVDQTVDSVATKYLLDFMSIAVCNQ